MKGLLLKDLFVTWKNAKSTLLICLVFMATGFFSDDVSFYTAFPCLLVGMMPITLLAYDEADRWPAYAAALPVSRAKTVAARYLTGLLMGGLMALICTCALVLTAPASDATAKGFLASSPMFTLGLLMMGALVPSALLLPFAYRWTVAKARVAYLILIGAAIGSITMLVSNVDSTDGMASAALPFSFFGAGVVLLLIVLGLYALSCGISIAIYRRRDL